MRNGFEANEISVGPASDYIQNGPDYEWAPSVRPGISVENKVPHEVLFALATTSDRGTDPFLAFSVPPGASREFTSRIYVHAFRTIGVTPGSEHDFSDPNFLANRITQENGCEISRLGPTTYWCVNQSGDRLKAKIGKSRKDIKRYHHQLTMA
ncbi:hypothetical protein P692DRAFT_20235955 [Suillus brevipes Sb2]|nr:hypothetical protein P692DRAFT_20235955 [Suillus brevipes Sb2]